MDTGAQAGSYGRGAVYVFEYIASDWIATSTPAALDCCQWRPVRQRSQPFRQSCPGRCTAGRCRRSAARSCSHGRPNCGRNRRIWRLRVVWLATASAGRWRSTAISCWSVRLLRWPVAEASTRYVFNGASWLAAAGPGLARPQPGGLVGWSVAAQAQRWLVGVPGYSGAPSHVGAAYWRDAADAIFIDGFDDPVPPPASPN